MANPKQPRRGQRSSDWGRPIVVNGRVGFVLDLYQKFGLPTMLVFLGIAVYFGWVRSPLTDIAEMMVTHDRNLMVMSCHILYMNDQEKKGDCVMKVMQHAATNNGKGGIP